jgi:hypothetical protein
MTKNEYVGKGIKTTRTLTVVTTHPVDSNWYENGWGADEALEYEKSLEEGELFEAIVSVAGSVTEGVTMTNECEIVDMEDEK